jgi:chemotaxis protein methyltransferase CheR
VNRLDETEFRSWASYVYSITRITLDAGKGYLIETRLAALARETASESYRELLDKVTADGTGALKRKVIGAITTNETSFFRDTSPFEMLRHKILPDLVDSRKRQLGSGRAITLRIWSAACSTGQEVYSSAIVCRETLPDPNKYDVRILGTDISDKVITQASAGKYTKLEIDRGFPPDKVAAYFQADGSNFKVRDSIRAAATFKTINLLEPLAFPNKFDIIFCRNVAIYFSEADKKRLYDGLSRVLAPDGYLLIGSTESLTGICPRFEPKRYMRSVFYQLGPGSA